MQPPTPKLKRVRVQGLRFKEGNITESIPHSETTDNCNTPKTITTLNRNFTIYSKDGLPFFFFL